MLAFKGNFSYCCDKVENSGSTEHVVKEFWPRESFESCRNMGKNLFVAEGYSLIDEERREGGTKNRSKWNLKTLLMERSTKERNKWVKTRSGSRDAYKRADHSTISVSVGGEIID